MRPPHDASSRERLLFFLKTKGPQTAADLGRRLGVTAVAARQHLAGLEQEGLVEHTDEAGRVGRPRRVWSLAEAAGERFPDSHAELALGMLAAARETFGERGVARLIEQRTAAQLEDYRARMPHGGTELSAKLAALARIRKQEGYLAEWSRAADGGYRLIENHCPICAAAQVCAGLCEGELELFRELLGPGVSVERTEYILGSDRRCTYAVREDAAG